MRLQHVIETTPNPEGSLYSAIVALSPSADNSFLAYPSPVPSPASLDKPPSSASSSQAGDVILFSTRSLTVANVIQAHKSPISFLSINSTGTLLATASDKGTVIRVWSIPGAEKLYQFRRGTREAKIYSINFNAVSTLLAVSSAHDTVHIFKLGLHKGGSVSGSGSGSGVHGSEGDSMGAGGSTRDSEEVSVQGSDGGFEFVGKEKHNISSSLRRRSLHLTKNFTSSVGGYLPNTLTEMWEPSRDFAFLRLPTSGARCIVALSPSLPQVMVISSDGYFYTYHIDLEQGGECSLQKQYGLVDSHDELND
ncbi:hypothetical protein NLI96_g4575 [Meripilus lineatus]|uniref:Autophagy-related protein 18 n=1 Tax=Meripilus lineatus TaxID=2056292 RepID=A0AAD5YEM6_9APHY|nr:hypothetical protein NLI96_g4575 [Physisporinus lineatus]